MLEKEYGIKRNTIHTHPYDPKTTMILDRSPDNKKAPNKNVGWEIPFPSEDLAGFLKDSKAKSFTVNPLLFFCLARSFAIIASLKFG